MNATLTKRHHITNTQAGSEVFQVKLYKALKKRFPPFVFNCRLTEKHDETPIKNVTKRVVMNMFNSNTGTSEMGKRGVSG